MIEINDFPIMVTVKIKTEKDLIFFGLLGSFPQSAIKIFPILEFLIEFYNEIGKYS